MLAKVYFYTWAVIAAAFFLLLAAGEMSTSNLVLFGFIAFGMVFMGMIAVLPSSIAHPVEEAEPKLFEDARKPVKASIRHSAHVQQV